MIEKIIINDTTDILPVFTVRRIQQDYESFQFLDEGRILCSVMKLMRNVVYFKSRYWRVRRSDSESLLFRVRGHGTHRVGIQS